MDEARREQDREGCTNRGIPLPALRQLRRSRGLSQRDLAELAGVSPGTVFRLENGLRGAYPTTMTKLASALGVQPKELVRGRPPGREGREQNPGPAGRRGQGDDGEAPIPPARHRLTRRAPESDKEV